MSGTVLSTLCSICHTEPPKYKCPRCSARTCSVSCIQKHKARADCDGVRNPRAFMPLSQLKTDSGIDHDFNFLSAIERARQRAERDVVEARQLLSEKELRPRNEDKVFQRVWHGDELHHVPVQSQPYKKHGRPQDGPAAIDSFDKHVRRRLRYLDTEAITMPKGMARQRENKTAWNRRTQTINWQVEWLVYNASELGFTAQQPDQPLRVLHKSLEGTPLHSALATTLDWHRGQLDRQSREQQQQDAIETDDEADPDSPKKRRKLHHGSTSNNTTNNNKKTPPTPPAQDPSTTTWPAAPFTAQYPLTTTWSSTTTTAHLEITLEEQLAATWRFYLVKAAVQTRASPSNTDSPRNNDIKPDSKTRTIVPLDSAETLTGVLRGRTVVEFPTFLAIPSGVPVPGGYVVGEFERRAARVVKEKGVSGGGGEGEGGGYDPSNGGDRNNNRKRGFEGRGGNGNNKSWDRGKGTGANAGAMGGSGRGAGWKRARFGDEEKRPARGSGAVQGPPPPFEAEAEEGEVNSDGDEVMDESLPLPLPRGGRMGGLLMDVDGDGSSVTLGRGGEDEDGEIMEGMEERKSGGGGLVDYGSSDEDEDD